MRLLIQGASLLLSSLAVFGLSVVTEKAGRFVSALGVSEGTIVARSPAQIPAISINKLPPEAKATIQLIRQGGPFPYRKDGTVFSNRERRLPSAPRGYYREYTVPTPGVSSRGPQRIVAGQNSEFYYTRDHYRSFLRVK